VTRFFALCGAHKHAQLVDIEPLHVAAYIEVLACQKPATDIGRANGSIAHHRYYAWQDVMMREIGQKSGKGPHSC
jgi:hypothetical protein